MSIFLMKQTVAVYEFFLFSSYPKTIKEASEALSFTQPTIQTILAILKKQNFADYLIIEPKIKKRHTSEEFMRMRLNSIQL